MAPDELDHAVVKRLFLEATGLPPGEREAFLDRACAGDARLRAEVRSLLGFHDSRTLLRPAAPLSTRRRVLTLAIVGALLVGALLADAAMRRSALQEATAALVAQAGQGADRIAAWMDARAAQTRGLASEPTLVDAAQELAVLATVQEPDAAARLRAAPAAGRVQEFAAQLLRQGGLELLALVDRDGRLLAGDSGPGMPSLQPGERVARADRLALEDAWRGATLVLPPEPRDTRGGAPGASLAVYAASVVAGAGGQQPAALVLAFPWEDELLTGEGPGLVRLLDSRGRSCASGPVAGGDLDRAAAEIAARRSGSSSAPYADAQGTLVIGAWRWLPAPGVGIVAERRLSEALAPLRPVQVALLLLVTGAATYLLLAAWRTARNAPRGVRP